MDNWRDAFFMLLPCAELGADARYEDGFVGRAAAGLEGAVVDDDLVDFEDACAMAQRLGSPTP